MAKMVLTKMYVELNAVDYSSYVAKAEIEDSYEEKDTTTFGSSGAKEVLGGLESGTIGLTFKNDYGGSALDQALWALRGTVITWKIRPNSAAVVSSANPQYSGSLLVNSIKEGGTVGDLAEMDVTYPMSGAMTRATTT